MPQARVKFPQVKQVSEVPTGHKEKAGIFSNPKKGNLTSPDRVTEFSVPA